MKDCPHCKYWRELSDKSVAHAMRYGPRLAELQMQRKWLARPYEGVEWLTTTTQPTDELRRWMEFREVPVQDKEMTQ